MNFSKSLLVIALCGVLFTGCKNTESKVPETNSTASSEAVKPETASFKIDGMTCAIGCAKTIEKKLAGTDGVQKVTVDFDKKTATVEFDANKQSAEKLAKIVEAVADGKTYKVSDVKSSGDHAMVFNKDKKKKSKKKAACCAGKKHCAEGEKATM